MATPAQIEANRRNALKSTGPRTPEGKAASRRNALTHGLAAETLVMPGEEPEAVAARVAAWSPSLKPVGEYDAWLVEEVVVNSLRIDRCRAHETALRTSSADRAALCWDEDRAAEAEELGAKLKRSPSLVSRQLRRSKQGCAWLIARWEGLRSTLETGGDWDEAQERLALDLLGTPKELRAGASPLEGDRPTLVTEQLEHLESLQAGPLAELDELDRSHAEVGLGRDLERPLALARRYESACRRRMDWARKQIGKGTPAGFMPAPRPATVEPARPAAPSPAPAKAIPTPSPPIPGATPLPVNHVGHMPFAAAPASSALNRQDRRALKSLARHA